MGQTFAIAGGGSAPERRSLADGVRYAMRSVPRYSREPFPPYRFVPGRRPHPTRDPAGHSYGRPEAVIALSPEAWSRCEPFLYAIDLFNHGYWWEAHEALEPMWRAAGRETADGRFLQGLIQVAAALLHRSMGTTAAARVKAEDGIAKLQGRRVSSFGLDVDVLIADTRACFDRPTAQPPIIRLSMPDRVE